MTRPLALLLGAALLAPLAACSSEKKKNDTGEKKSSDGTDAGEEKDTGPKIVTVSWDKYAGSVLQFKIWVGKSETDKGKVLEVVDLDEKPEGFDPDEPKMEFDTSKTSALKDLVGGQACFWLVAVGDEENSPPSEKVCEDL